MKNNKGYRSIPLDLTRRMVIASVNGNKKNAIHCLTKIDVSRPRAFRQEHFERTGEKLSFTAYIIRCFAETIKSFPEMNSFIKGKRLILLDDIRISVLIEREIGGVKVPEPLGISRAGEKNVKELSEEIRQAVEKPGEGLGDLSGTRFIRFIPAFLLRTFVRLADRNISMAKRYGKIAVTAVGMYASDATWFIPHGTATVLLTVGSIGKETGTGEGGGDRELLHLTASFDHEIIDGSPAARFMTRFEEILRDGVFMKEACSNNTSA